MSIETPLVARGRPLRAATVAVCCAAMLLALGWNVKAKTSQYVEAGRAQRPDVRPQRTVDIPAPDALPSVAVGAPVVLTYHEVSPASQGRYNIVPQRFAQDMSSLHAAGWRTVSASQYLSWLRGETALPAKSMLLTFDDATSGTWIYVDPILRKFGYRATAFIVSGFVGRGDYYMTWAEIGRLAKTGRWEFGAHGAAGHSMVATDKAGTQGPFFINRAWADGRPESLQGFRTRIEDDLTANVDAMVSHGLRRPRFFAFPYSAAWEPANDEAAAALANETVGRLFDGAMTDDVEAPRDGRPDRYDVARLGVTSDVPLPALLGRQPTTVTGSVR